MAGALATCVAADGRAQARAGRVEITIAVYSTASAHVDERYFLGPSSQPLTLQVLGRPCTRIENVAFERNGARIAFAESRNGPWTTWSDTTRTGDTAGLGVHYDVSLTGDGSIPLVHLGVPLARKDSNLVDIRVIGMGEVEFPHMTRAVPPDQQALRVSGDSTTGRNGTRQAVTEWSGRYVAVPSFVKLRGGGECAETTAGDNGGLVWRFVLLVGIMVAWVPIYLVWARRTGEDA